MKDISGFSHPEKDEKTFTPSEQCKSKLCKAALREGRSAECDWNTEFEIHGRKIYLSHILHNSELQGKVKLMEKQ